MILKNLLEKCTSRSVQPDAMEEPIGFQFIPGESDDFRRGNGDGRADLFEVSAGGGVRSEFRVDRWNEQRDSFALTDFQDGWNEGRVVATRNGEGFIGALAGRTQAWPKVRSNEREVAIKLAGGLMEAIDQFHPASGRRDENSNPAFTGDA